MRLFLENLDKAQTDALAFDLRVHHAGQLAQEEVGCIDIDQIEFGLLPEKPHDRLGLTGPHQPVIDVDAGELIAYGPMDNGRHHRGIDSAG